MKEHIEAIQKYIKEKYGVGANINIFIHNTESEEQALVIVSDSAKELKQEKKYGEAEDGKYKWYQTSSSTSDIHIVAFYEG